MLQPVFLFGNVEHFWKHLNLHDALRLYVSVWTMNFDCTQFVRGKSGPSGSSSACDRNEDMEELRNMTTERTVSLDNLRVGTEAFQFRNECPRQQTRP
jgi:hypothetical protein